MGFFSFDQLQEQLQELWSFWEVRGIVLFSLFLQSLLILVSPFRTKTANGVISRLLWLAYLLADAAATFAVGLIAHSQGDTSVDKTNGELLAFWAPILIIHLGGPDTITALALEDNELWQRHLLQLLAQLAATLYVLYKSLTRDSELLAPTILVLIVGLIKYGERVYSLYLASVNKFRDSLLTKPDPGHNYDNYRAKVNNKPRKGADQNEHTYKIVQDAYKCFTRFKGILGNKMNPVLSDTDKDRSDIEMVQDGYKCYTKFKGLVADLIYSNEDWQETRKYFSKRNPEQAFRVVEIELNFLYEALYTKMPVIRTWVGYMLRLVCFVLVLVSFFLWYSIDKSHISPHDVKITYALLGGAITLDVIAFFMLIFSDWPIANVMKGASGPEDESQQKNKKSTCRYKLKPLINRYLAVSDRRWSGYSKTDRTMLRKLLSQIFCFRRPNSAAQGDETTLPFTAMASRIFYRRWSESVQQFNLIDYSVNARNQKIEKVFGWLGLTDFLDGIRYVSIRWFSESLRDSIFKELKEKSDTMENPEDADKICKVRGEWVLDYGLRKILEPWLTDAHYDESLILWHIATEICYHHDNKQNDQQTPDAENDDESDLLHEENDIEKQKSHESVEEEDHVQPQRSQDQIEKEEDIDAKRKKGPQSTSAANEKDDVERQKIDREVAKTLSDYMLYLLIMQPEIMTTVAGFVRFRFRITSADTCLEAKKFSKYLVMDKKRKNRVRNACSKLSEVGADIPPREAKGDRSKSLLFEGCRLAKELNKLGDAKWKVIHKVWVEMLCYAATHCSGRTHAAQLSKGGQLITFVWLLMVHLGLGKQFEMNE